MTEIQTPNEDSANDGSLAGALQEMLTAWLRESVDDMLPAEVVSYDENSNRVTIRPLVMIGTTDGLKVPKPILVNIPVFRFGGSGFYMRFKLVAGDKGWIKATDRDMSLVIQRGWQQDWPNTVRLHSFSDGVFFPDVVKDWQSSDAEFAIMSDSGTSFEMSSDEIKLKCGSSELIINSSGVTINAANVSINAATMDNNGTNIGSNHRHGGVETGSGTSGTPI